MFESLDELRAATAPGDELRALGGVVDDATVNATIELEAGAYLTPLAIEKSLTLKGPADGWAVFAGVAGAPALEVVEPAREVVLERLVLRGATNDLGALVIENDAHVTLRECILLDNTSTAQVPAGGGVTIGAGALRCERCVFVGNKGPSGGALAIRRVARLLAVGCVFVENTSERGGGAVYVDEACQVSLINCTFVGDRSHDGGAGYTLESRPGTGRFPEVSLVNCVIRSEPRCFGFSDDAPISAVGCVLPEHAKEYRALEHSGCWFGAAPLGEFPFALLKGSPADAPGDKFRAMEASTGIDGAPLRSDQGELVRGAIAPR